MMTHHEKLLARRKELIAEIQRIADGYGELARDTDRKLAAWAKHRRDNGLTRAEARVYE